MSNLISRQVETIDPAIVETIVREVMDRLKGSAIVPTTAVDQGSQPDSSAELELADRVVTLESIRNKLDGVSRIVVAENSIVTPAVKDELNARRVQLLVQSKEMGSSPVAGSNPFCVARLSSHFVATEWLRSMGSLRVCCGEDYGQLADKIAIEFSEIKTLCFAAQPYVAVAALNQNGAIRAAYGRTVKDVAEIKSTLDANVLVLDSVQSRDQQAELIELFVTPAKGVA